jgi:tRNA(fMet)-specific endonuclease VapC
MGLILETSLLIAAERRKFDLPAFLAAHPGEMLGLAAITISELRHGCLRAVDLHIRQRRERFVNGVISRCSVIPFGPTEAEQHAAIWVDLETKGQMIGPNDLLIAATARAHGHSLATLNHSEFVRIPGLVLIQVSPFQRDV